MKKNIGSLFTNTIHKLSEKNLSAVTPQLSTNMSSLLTTNEFIDKSFTINKKNNPVDGYIIGVGFGNIFKMLELFLPESHPKAILCIDVRPEVVLMGKIIINKLILSKNFNAFLTSVYSITLDEINYVVNDEPNKNIKSQLQQSSAYILQVFNNSTSFVKKGAYLTQSIQDIFSDNFDFLKELAEANNIGVALISLTDISLIESILELENFANVRSVIYLSNAIDHITNRGEDLHLINSLVQLKQIQTSRKNVFVDTTQNLNYILRIKTSPPKYSSKDYPSEIN